MFGFGSLVGAVCQTGACSEGSSAGSLAVILVGLMPLVMVAISVAFVVFGERGRKS